MQLENRCALGGLSLCDPFWAIRQSEILVTQGSGTLGPAISQFLSTIKTVYNRLEVCHFLSPDTQHQASLRREHIKPRHFACNLSMMAGIICHPYSFVEVLFPSTSGCEYLDTGSLRR